LALLGLITTLYHQVTKMAGEKAAAERADCPRPRFVT
jgi:hypothetical protein